MKILKLSDKYPIIKLKAKNSMARMPNTKIQGGMNNEN